MLAIDVRVPVPSAPPMDNLSKCRHFLPDDHPDAIAAIAKRVKTDEQKAISQRYKDRYYKKVQSILGTGTSPWLHQLMDNCPTSDEDPIFRLLREAVTGKLQ